MVNKEKTENISAVPGPAMAQTRQLVAAALLEQAGRRDGEHRHFTLKNMAATAGAEWGTIRLSLTSLQNEGAIRLERHRIYINRDALRRLAGSRVSP